MAVTHQSATGVATATWHATTSSPFEQRVLNRQQPALAFPGPRRARVRAAPNRRDDGDDADTRPSRNAGFPLLDEPFSALDMPIRRELHRELRRLQQETGLATVIVTHDPQEAAFLSQEVIVISDGPSLQSGTNRQVFSRPASPEVARLLGISNLHHALVVAPGRIDSGGAVVAADTGGMGPGAEVLWSIRPENVIVRALDAQASLELASLDSADKGLVGTLSDIADVGTAVDLLVTLNDQLELHARVVDSVELRVGQRCQVAMDARAISLWANPKGPLVPALAKGSATH